MGKFKNLIPSIELALAAFAGGMVLSLLELMNMARAHEKINDPMFYLGMLIAGVLGIFGLVVSRSKDVGGAVAAGIAAPQILAGIAKAGVVQTAMAFMVTPIYAQPVPYQDSLSITIVSEADRSLEVQVLHDTTRHALVDTLKMKVPAAGSLIFSGKGIDPVTLDLSGVKVRAVIHASLSVKQAKLGTGLLRGMFAQQMGRPKEDTYEVNLRMTYDP